MVAILKNVSPKPGDKLTGYRVTPPAGFCRGHIGHICSFLQLHFLHIVLELELINCSIVRIRIINYMAAKGSRGRLVCVYVVCLWCPVRVSREGLQEHEKILLDIYHLTHLVLLFHCSLVPDQGLGMRLVSL